MSAALRVGSLFSGYGGLDMGLGRVLDTETAWVADVCGDPSKGRPHREPHRSPCSILAHRYPGVPNLGDVTTVDWSQVEPVDVITGGSPCQDLSHAGKRAGMTAGTRSNLWVAMREAIAVIRPRLVLWENVRGAYSACADSDLGRCPRCMGAPGARGHAPVLRALGRVLGDLSSLGYDAAWHGLRAADVGAPHGRFRVFVLAWRADDAAELTWRADDAAELTWRADDAAELTWRADDAAELLPTPAVNDMGAAYTPEEWDAWTERMKEAHGNGNGHGKSLSIEAQRLTVPGDGSTLGDAEGGVDLVCDGVAGGVLPGVDLDESGEVADGFGAEVEFHDSTLVPVSQAHQTSWEKSDQDHLLPTPRATRGGSSTETMYSLGGDRSDDERPQGQVLLPTPRTSDTNGAGAHGDGGLDLRTAVSLLPTPTSRDDKGRNQRDDASCLTGALLPTPRATDGAKGGPNQRGSSGDLMLPSAVTLLPTPTCTQRGTDANLGTREGARANLHNEVVGSDRWGQYAPAIARWEAVTRPAPPPTEATGKGGAHRLSPRFVEWMMGLPDGWVTDVPGVSRNDALKALGNGVVPQQAAVAVRHLLDVRASAEVAA